MSSRATAGSACATATAPLGACGCRCPRQVKARATRMLAARRCLRVLPADLPFTLPLAKADPTYSWRRYNCSLSHKRKLPARNCACFPRCLRLPLLTLCEEGSHHANACCPRMPGAAARGHTLFPNPLANEDPICSCREYSCRTNDPYLQPTLTPSRMGLYPAPSRKRGRAELARMTTEYVAPVSVSYTDNTLRIYCATTPAMH